MGLLVMILGLVLFLGVHTLPAQRELRARMIGSLGEGSYKIGYALVSFHDRDDSHTTGDRFAELQSLVVEPARRGGGLGTDLLHEVYRHVRRRGVGEMVIGVLATNEQAKRLYEREGFRPWVILTMGTVPDPDA